MRYRSHKMNTLYFGDNLDILRKYIADESVDLIYLDPPFNSKRNYNILFKSPKGQDSDAQMTAFEDTWRWGEQAEREFDEVLSSANAKAAEMVRTIRLALGESDVMAYLTMMANRLLELHRVLKKTGSIYLHCDPVASHYLKVVMDSIFGPKNFRNEIVWRRSNAHNNTTWRYGPIHDVILFYSKANAFKFHPGHRPYTRKYIEERFKHEDHRGKYQTNYLTGPGTRQGNSGKPWGGFDPTGAGRHWAIPSSLRPFLPNKGKGMTSQEQLDKLYELDLIVFPQKEGGQPMYKQYIGPGVPLQDVWAYQPNTQGVLYRSDECIDEDVKWLEDEAEKLGYPTQKPVGLLTRIIESSSDAGDIVLDPFCGCGTTLHASQKLNRKWIGIDIAPLAISLIEKRLVEAFPSIRYEVGGIPKTLGGAAELASRDKHKFEMWAVLLVGAQPAKDGKKGADKGIDGQKFFTDIDPKTRKRVSGKIIVSVKGGENVGVSMIRDLVGTMQRAKADLAFFVTLKEPTKPMITEAVSAGFYKAGDGKSYPRVQILTIEGLLNGTERPEYFDTGEHGNLNFKKAERDAGPDLNQRLL